MLLRPWVFGWLLLIFIVSNSGLLFSHSHSNEHWRWPSRQLLSSVSSYDCELWPVTLTFEVDLGSLKMNQHASIFISHTDTHQTNSSIWTTKMVGNKIIQLIVSLLCYCCHCYVAGVHVSPCLLISNSTSQPSDLTEATVSQFRTRRVVAGSMLLSPGQQCRVCLRQYINGDLVRYLPCRHHFHRACIDQWLLHRHPTCPVDGIVYTNESVRLLHEAHRQRSVSTMSGQWYGHSHFKSRYPHQW